MKKLLWLDDERNPNNTYWQRYIKRTFSLDTLEDIEITWVKTHEEFTEYLKCNGVPEYVCYDYDLGKSSCHTGFDCAMHFLFYNSFKHYSEPKWECHSTNKVGKIKIETLLSKK